MKNLGLLLLVLFSYFATSAQLRMGIVGGPHSASVNETNTVPGWNTEIKPRYSSRGGLNLGILIDVSLSSNNRWFLSPSIMYMSKGRKYYMRNDTVTSIQSDTISASHNLAVNYIDIPFNLTYKMNLGKKAKFIVSAGPYIGLFYNGKQTFATRIYSSNTFKDEERKLETGNEEGKMKTFNAGWNARAGFELGSVILTGFMSNGLTNFYTASYEGSFRHQVRGISVGFWLNKVKSTPRTAPAPADSDKDGITDSDDKCPQTAGGSLTNGCPDGDADGIADMNDSCPTVPGKLKYAGCPVPDTDGDGMNDESDACPQLAGIPDFNGCPVPDMDGDGLNDREDKCPAEAGVAANAGCPEVKKEVKQKVMMAAKNIFFKAGSNDLAESSYEALDEVVNVLRENTAYTLQIEGHTDSTGTVTGNKILSQSRAEAVKRYFISKGVDAARLTATGYGSSRPIDTNETTEGRSRNRRVELKLDR